MRGTGSLLAFAVIIVAQAVTDDKASDNPGYDVTPLSLRQFPAKMRNVFNDGALISANQYCREDAAAYCAKLSSDNLLLLPCLQNQAEKVSRVCHQLLWKYKVYLTTTVAVNVPLFTHCKSQFPKLPGCNGTNSANGEMVACILNSKKNITDKACRVTVFRMQRIVFSDHRLIFGFNKACGSDIYQFKCGRVEKNNTMVFDTGAGNQGQVVACLEENIDKVAPKCQEQIKKKEEVAAESVELDAALYQSCQLEVDVMCKSIPPGKGNLYRCLYDHLHEPTMKTRCRKQLLRRGKEESLDYKVNFKFAEACGKAIKRYSCDSEGYTEGSFTHTTSVLQCLNNHVDKDEDLTDDCKAEMAMMVEKLMGNYQLDMTLATACDTDVVDHCSIEKNIRTEGGVISCLLRMEKRKQLSDACSDQVQQLIGAAAPTFTFSVDHITKEKCSDLLNKRCSDVQNKKRFGCLMDHATDEDTSEICRSHLLTLQYFLARDYRMDQPLRDACHDDISKVCNLEYRSATVEYPPSHVLHCLYTSYLNPSTKDGISSGCIQEVKRLMVIRASSINLNPYIDKVCMEDSSVFCGTIDNSAPGEEFRCLQENIETLATACHEAIGNWTAMESQDLRMNRPLFKPCGAMVQKYCMNVPRGSGEVIHCLALNKNQLEFSDECRRQVTTFQMSVLKKFQFDRAFVTACGNSAHLLCDLDATKAEVVSCLQTKMSDLSTPCREIMRKEQLEKNENIHLNPSIDEACARDVEELCSDVSAGEGKLLECLRKHFSKLSLPCSAALEPQQAAAIRDSRVDFVLMRSCKEGIEQFCSQVDPPGVLDCLIAHKFKLAINSKCRAAIVTREAILFQDPTLNSKLMKVCGEDFKTHCPDEPTYTIIRCLSDLKGDEISPPCSNLMTKLQREKQTDYRFNRELIDSCEGNEVFEDCVSSNSPGHGSVIECLKKNVQSLSSNGHTDCEKAVSKLITVASTDVHIDVVLDQECSADIAKFCSKVAPSKGKVIFCLIRIQRRSASKMSPECIAALDARKKMWKVANVKAVKRAEEEENSEDADKYDYTKSISKQPGSNSRMYGLLLCGAVVVIVLGYLCGRRCRKTARKYS